MIFLKRVKDKQIKSIKDFDISHVEAKLEENNRSNYLEVLHNKAVLKNFVKFIC